MKKEMDQKNKIIKSFCVVGLSDDHLNYYEEKEKSKKYIQNIDILVKKFSTSKNILKREEKNEKWLRVLKDSDTWFRIKNSEKYNNPITDFKIIGCKFDDTKNYLLIEKKHIEAKFYPIRVTIEKDNDNNNENDLSKVISVLDEYIPIKENNDDNNYVKISKDFDLKAYMNLPLKNEAGIILVTREYSSLPLLNIQIKQINNNSFQFARSKHKSPFINKFTPEVIDQYPKSDSFNNSVSMFCFPDGVTILERKIDPKKFNFVLTDEVGKRTYGSCLIFWEKLNDNKRKSMEPIYDEKIEITEEENEKKENENKKIKKTKLKDYYSPKALCILSKYPFFSNCTIFLRELYKIFDSSSTLIPIERAVCGFVDSLYRESYNKLIRFSINKSILDFYFIPKYGKDWDINDQYLETLFNVLSIDIISTAWQGLLLEKKLFLICSSKETLIQVAHSFITLLFPFKWIHTYIPILPEKLKAFTESPMPLIFGIPFEININELPDDGLIININKNCFENYREEIPKLTGKLKAFFDKKLNNLKDKYKIEKPTNTDKWMDYLDQVEPKEIPENSNKIDCGEIRDVFYDVFIHMFKNYPKYFKLDKFKDNEIKKENQDEQNENEEDDEEEQQIEFKRETFLKDHGSTDDGSFLSMFCDTALFNQFISSIPLLKQDGSTAYFFECIKKGKGKNQVYLPNIIPKEIVFAKNIKIDDLNGKEFFYGTFPQLDKNLFIKSEVPIKPYKSKFIFQKDEWCYEASKLKKKEWPRYFLYLIYEIWYYFFSISIPFYEKSKSKDLMEYAIHLLEDLIYRKKIVPTRNLFSKLFKACGRNELSSFTKKVLVLANNVYKKSGSALFQNEYLNGLYALTGNVNINNTVTMSFTNSVFAEISTKQSILEDITYNNNTNFEYFDDFIFLTENYCPYCTKNLSKIKFISIEEILAGFNKKINKLNSICPHCLTVIDPTIYYLKKKDKKIDIKKFNLLTPFKIINEIDEINKSFGEYYFYLSKKSDNYKMDNLFKSIIFYFKLFDLPLFVLYIENNEEKFKENILKEIVENIGRKRPLKRKGTKDSISPDRRAKDKRSKQLDASDDNKSISGIGTLTGDTSSIISGKSDKSSGTSLMEKELWKDIILKNRDKIKLTGDKIGTQDRSDVLNRIKYMKSVLSDITNYFVTSYKEKLEEYLTEGGFYNDIKEKESISTNTESNDIENPFIDKNKIHKIRPQSCDRKKYSSFNNINNNNYKGKNNNNNKFINYESNAFDAIIQQNREENSKIENRKSYKIPAGFDQINQLNNPNEVKSKGFGNTFKKMFGFGQKKNSNNKEEDK